MTGLKLMVASLDGYDITGGPPVEVPVLVVVGRHDYVASHGLWTEERKAPLKNLDFHVLERSGHTPQLESPAEFDGLLLDWLRAEALLRRSGSESL
ncbi:MAG: alpha/beta hydrolase [Longimicrobiales bacterium]